MKLESTIGSVSSQECSSFGEGAHPGLKGAEVGDGSEKLLEVFLADAARPSRIDGVVVGMLRGFDEHGTPLVDFALNPEVYPLAARATVLLSEADREVALLFEQGDPHKPIIIGQMWAAETASTERGEAGEDLSVRLRLDGERLSITAEREIVLECGEASITLTRAGKVLIRGAFVLTESTGVNRIRGGSVQIN